MKVELRDLDYKIFDNGRRGYLRIPLGEHVLEIKGSGHEIRSLAAILGFKDVEIRIMKKENVLIEEKKVKKQQMVVRRRNVDWSTYISDEVLAEIERVMKKLERFTVKDVVSKSGYSRTTVRRAVKKLLLQGKIKASEEVGVYVYKQ